MKRQLDTAPEPEPKAARLDYPLDKLWRFISCEDRNFLVWEWDPCSIDLTQRKLVAEAFMKCLKNKEDRFYLNTVIEWITETFDDPRVGDLPPPDEFKGFTRNSIGPLKRRYDVDLLYPTFDGFCIFYSRD